jgi:multidrug efflux pump subunit AcrA (membrane-fusion protein)
MFIRATIMLQRIEDAIIVPAMALTHRDDREGVFMVDADGKTARWQVVEPGIRQGDRLQVSGAALSGQVVVLGQQLLDDGSEMRIVEAGQ